MKVLVSVDCETIVTQTWVPITQFDSDLGHTVATGVIMALNQQPNARPKAFSIHMLIGLLIVTTVIEPHQLLSSLELAVNDDTGFLTFSVANLRRQQAPLLLLELGVMLRESAESASAGSSGRRSIANASMRRGVSLKSRGNRLNMNVSRNGSREQLNEQLNQPSEMVFWSLLFFVCFRNPHCF